MNFKFTALICFILGINQFAHAQTDSTLYKKVEGLVLEAKQKYAPDKRTKIVALVQADAKKNTYVIESTEKEANTFLQSKIKGLPGKISIKSLPDTSIGENIYGVINLSVANLRTQPGNASEMATQALLGTQVDILQKDRGEFRVRTPEGYISYIPASSLVPMNAKEIADWKNSKKVIYTQEFGKSYSKADPASIRVSDLVYGDILALTAESGDFYQVSYPDKRIAFIPKSEALSFDQWLATRQLTSENVLSSAKTMMGLPYLWGGTSVKGVDCSGFTKTAYYMNGYVIPRDASQQVLVGDKIDILDKDGHFDAEKALKNLKPADLLFFASGKNSNPNARVTHVALYIGNGEFIHAAGTVRINSMLKNASNYDDFQTRTVVAARRYIGAEDAQIQKVQNNAYYKP